MSDQSLYLVLEHSTGLVPGLELKSGLCQVQRSELDGSGGGEGRD